MQLTLRFRREFQVHGEFDQENNYLGRLINAYDRQCQVQDPRSTAIVTFRIYFGCLARTINSMAIFRGYGRNRFLISYGWTAVY